MFYIVTLDQDFLINKYFVWEFIFFVRRKERNIFPVSYCQNISLTCEIGWLNNIPQGPSTQCGSV